MSVGGKHIGLTHGHRPFVIEKRDRVRKLLGFKTDPWNGMFGDLLRWFKDDAIEAIVFGHWHRTYSGVHDGVLLFNPDARHAALADDRATAFRAPSRAAGLAAPLRSHPPPECRPIPTVGRLTIGDDGALSTDIIELPRVM
ncbi:MAG: hypothetical protein IPK52_19855 [Chloroflexi bacterium]|nr:hypothetical protein [Chloroflexota bacterium]